MAVFEASPASSRSSSRTSRRRLKRTRALSLSLARNIQNKTGRKEPARTTPRVPHPAYSPN